jgi:hypothetical protein
VGRTKGKEGGGGDLIACVLTTFSDWVLVYIAYVARVLYYLSEGRNAVETVGEVRRGRGGWFRWALTVLVYDDDAGAWAGAWSNRLW